MRRPLATIVPVVALGLVVAGCGSTDPGADADLDTDVAATVAVAPDDLLAAIVSEFVGVADGGAVVLLDWNGERERVAVGAASDDGIVLDPDRVFRVGSISKPFVATMVLQLVDEGAIELDDTLGDHLPDTPVGADTTIRQLLSHRSGIANYTDQLTFFADVFADREAVVPSEEIIEYVIDEPIEDVGEFAYSNTNYVLLGQLVEAIDGGDLGASLRTRISEPLALDHTAFDLGDGSLSADLVGGWSAAGDDGDPDAPFASVASTAWAAGALVSTVDDLSTFLTALVSGELISDDALAAMTDVGDSGYGLGVLRVVFSASQTGVGHNGSIPGFSSTMAIDPDTGDLLVVLTNNDALVADLLAFEILTTPGLLD